ncbi:MAG: NAD(P)-dependent oxidoreductase, partial [Caulobacteraceae bacterium]
MEAFPAFFPLAGARIVVAGSGRGAEARRHLLAGSPAEVLTLEGVEAEDPIRYSGAALAFVASPDALFRRTAAEAARAAGVPVNVLDEPALCD